MIMTESRELYEKLVSGQTSDIDPESRIEARLLTMVKDGVGLGEGAAGVTEPTSRVEAYLLAMIVAGIAGAGSDSPSGPVGDVSWNDLTDKPFGEEPDGTVKKLDEKYLPDNLVTTDNISSALPDDLVTTSELDAAINNALGVIENGTY